MTYFIKSKAGLAIECHRNSEMYLALEMESPSPIEVYLLQPVPWRRDVSAGDPGGLNGQFMRSAKRQVRYGAARSVSRLPASGPTWAVIRWRTYETLLGPGLQTSAAIILRLNGPYISCMRPQW
jgi:hypothetical protein